MIPNEKKIKNTNTLKWYVIHTHAGFENYVAKSLNEKIKVSSNMKYYFGKIIVPSEKVIEMKNGKKKKSERKFFPGYVFVQLILNNNTWYFIKDLPKVSGFIGGEFPRPISDHEANNILKQIEEGSDKPKPKILFESGEVIRVIDGPFTEFNGVVEEINYEKNILKVSVFIFGRSTPVKLEFNQVEKI